MKKIKLNALFALLTAIVFLAGCSKDEEKPSYVAPKIAGQSTIIEAPAALQTSSDPDAAMINGYISLVNAFGSMPAYFAALPANAVEEDLKSSGRSWTWSDNQGNSVWIEFTESTLEYSWKYYYKTSLMASRMLLVSATELKTGLGGTLYIYDYENPGTAVISYTWSKAANGTITATLLFNNGDEAVFFDLTVNADKSGDFEAYIGTSSAGVKFIDVTWNAAGHGDWWVKDPDTGETASGTF